MLADINAWWQRNAAAGRTSLLMAYSLGKAQRLLAGVDASIGPMLVHGAVEPLNEVYRAAGVALAPCLPAAQVSAREALSRALVIAPPAVHGSAWARRFGDFSDAFASGWMQLRGARRRQGVDRGFVLSDHADWPGLQAAIRATGAERVIVTHGYEAVMVRWLREQGLQAGSFRTEFGDEAAAEADRRDHERPARCSGCRRPGRWTSSTKPSRCASSSMRVFSASTVATSFFVPWLALVVDDALHQQRRPGAGPSCPSGRRCRTRR